MSTDAWDYCREKTALPGSSHYYALRLAAPDQRELLLACFAFRREIEDIPRECSDRGVARLKLDWWRQEIGRWPRHEGRHPVSRALDENGLGTAPFLALVDATEQLLLRREFADMNALGSVFRHGDGELLAAIEHHLSPGANPRRGAELAAGIGLVRLLRDLAPLQRRGLAVLPADLLARHGLAKTGLRESDIGAERALREYLDYAHAALQRARDCTKLRPLRALAATHQALCRELARTPLAVLDQRVELTPLRKLWVGWRA